MISLGKLGVQRFGPAMDIDALRLQFDQQHYLRLPDFLDPESLSAEIYAGGSSIT